MRPAQIAAGNDAGRSKVASLASLLNLYVEVQSNPNSEIRATLLSCPGSRKLFTIDGGIQITGIHITAKKVFFTTRKGLYEITGERYAKRADLNISGRVSMADNGTNLLIMDGYNAYSYDMDTGIYETLDFINCNSLIFLHGYFLAVEKNTNRQRCSTFYTAEFNDPVLEANCEASPDNIVAVAENQGQAFFFNQKTIEPWYLSGEDYPFNPSQSSLANRGCYTPFSWTAAADTLFFLGDDKIVYAMRGYTPIRISTHSEEYQLSRVDCAGAYMESYSSEGHDFVLLQIPELDYTLCYDASTGMWHNRRTGNGKHFSNCMATLDGITYVGHSSSASISVLDQDLASDDGVLMQYEMITPVDTYRGRINSAELVLQYFNPPSPAKLDIGLTSLEKKINAKWPVIYMAYTDDDGYTWSVDDPIELEPRTEMRAVWNKLGFTTRRSYRFRLKSNIPCAWAGLWLS